MPGKAEENERVVRDYFEALAARDTSGMADAWQDGGVEHLIGLARLTAPGEVTAWFEELFRTFPDLAFSVEDLVADDHGAAVHWSATGTFSGEGSFEGLKPNGAEVSIEGVDLLTVDDGRITRNTAAMNGLDLARQLGAVPPSGSAADRALAMAFNARTAAVKAGSDLAARLRS
jgi:steroid delta-isomerase-like uncharacterized protein